jgi:hypothetical protein
MRLMMKSEQKRLIPFLTALVFSTLACRPIITIGWSEIGILLMIFLVLLGPPLFRLYQRFNDFRDWKTKKAEDKKEN